MLSLCRFPLTFGTSVVIEHQGLLFSIYKACPRSETYFLATVNMSSNIAVVSREGRNMPKLFSGVIERSKPVAAWIAELNWPQIQKKCCLKGSKWPNMLMRVFQCNFDVRFFNELLKVFRFQGDTGEHRSQHKSTRVTSPKLRRSHE